LQAEGDSRLIRVALQNLIAMLEIYSKTPRKLKSNSAKQSSNGDRAYFVVTMARDLTSPYASRLFGAFQRLHAANEFSRHRHRAGDRAADFHRHGGSVWAEGIVNRGATIYFHVGTAKYLTWRRGCWTK